MRKLTPWWPFRATSEPDVSVVMDHSASTIPRSDTTSNALPNHQVDHQSDEISSSHPRSEQAYKRDLSLGGVIMVGLGAKRFLLPTLLVTHPILFTFAASTTVATGYHYLRRFWHGLTTEEKMSGEAITGTVSIATLALGNGVPALASIWFLNLAGYLKARAMTYQPPEKQLEAERAAILQIETERLGKLFTLASWGVIGAGIGSYVAQNRVQLANLISLSHIIQYVSTSPYGPLLYIGLYAIQPPFLMSEGLFTAAGGFLFGPIWGMLYATVGSNAEALYSYTLGRYFGPRILEKLDAADKAEHYGKPLKENTFETVLTMRLLMIPHDITSCLAGTLQAEWKPFLLATALGSIPINTSLVLFGSSITTGTLTTVPSINPSTLAASGVIFVSSMAVSRYLKQQKESDSESDELPGDLAYLGGA